jgi:hypothetical protein
MAKANKVTAMAKANKVTAEQLSTIERLVKLSFHFTMVTYFLFSILLIALPAPPTEIATTKLYIMLFTTLSSVWFVNTMLMYDTMNDLIRTHNQNNKNKICSISSLTMILCVVCIGLQLFTALVTLLVIIGGTNICYAILPFYLLSIIWLGIYVIFLIYGAVMVCKIYNISIGVGKYF